MKVLVTGSEGQLARSFIERCRTRKDFEILAVGRDTLNFEEVGRASTVVAEARPDLVINAAAYTAVDQAEDEPDRAFMVNARAAGELAAAAARLGASIIQISTDYVFDGTMDGSYDEAAEPNPLSVYGRSKLAGEELVTAANPRHVIIRTAWVYSPFGRNFVKTMMSAAATWTSLRVVDDQRGSPSSALALADGLVRLVEAEASSRPESAGRLYNLAGSGSASWYDLACAIMEECRIHGLPAADVQPIATKDWPTKAVRPRNSVLDSNRFAREFGFRMPSWRDSLKVVVDRLAAET